MKPPRAPGFKVPGDLQGDLDATNAHQEVKFDPVTPARTVSDEGDPAPAFTETFKFRPAAAA